MFWRTAFLLDQRSKKNKVKINQFISQLVRRIVLYLSNFFTQIRRLILKWHENEHLLIIFWSLEIDALCTRKMRIGIKNRGKSRWTMKVSNKMLVVKTRTCIFWCWYNFNASRKNVIQRLWQNVAALKF